MSEEFKLGDLVWAKLKGCPPWPGIIAKPKLHVKKPPKKTGVQWIKFFGSNDFAWIDDINIKPYLEFKEQLADSIKKASFKKAVREIELYIEKKKNDPEFDPEKDEDEEEGKDEFDKLKEEEKEEVKTPKKRKDSGVKKERSSSTTKVAAKKRRLDDSEENGATSSFTSNHVSNRSYQELLDRPSILDVPHSPTIDINNVSESFKSKKIEASKSRFGFIGLGIMGTEIVKNLINSGHRINLWNRSSRKAEEIKAQSEVNHAGLVEVYPAPCDVVENSDIIFCCVSDPAAAMHVVYGNCGILHNRISLEGKGYVEMTTIDSETSMDICNMITDIGGRYLEAQLQGSKLEASEGNLIVLGAGDKSLFDDCNSCFKAISHTAYYLSGVGFATKMNLVIQVIKSVALAGLAEAFALADRSGVTPKDVLEVLTLTNISNPYLQRKAKMIVETDFQTVEHPLQHMQKDTKLALQLADTLKQPLPMTAMANEIYKHTRRFGCDSHDASSVYMRTRH
ncbi:cytokine-like nuclear factor N-PAC [Onthophagus taurus]|uniref:cytokine-like nuclear factor N-PAC n=1 Tax=Onthophagus taurus TaxID=166361 RepID=UPI000C203BCE|nr:putative oxidoreductase GLYR1 homolog [Onthophagus taurus]